MAALVAVLVVFLVVSLAVCLVPVLVPALAVGLAPALASVRAMSPTGGGLSPACYSFTLFSHSLECLLLALHSSECLPPTPLNELEIETYSNFNAIYNFGIDSLRNISL